MYGRAKNNRRISRQAKKKDVSVEVSGSKKRKSMDSSENNNNMESGRVNKIMKIKKEHSVSRKKTTSLNEEVQKRNEDDIEMIRAGEEDMEHNEEVEDAPVAKEDSEKEDELSKKKMINDLSDQEEEEDDPENVNEIKANGGEIDKDVAVNKDQESTGQDVDQTRTEIPTDLTISPNPLQNMSSNIIDDICKNITENVCKKVIEELNKERKEKEQYINIIYHLMNIMEEKNPDKVMKYMKMKSVNQVFSPSVYKTLFGKFIMYEINKILGDLKKWNVSDEDSNLLEFSKLIRSVMYSCTRGHGNKKLFKADITMEEKHNIMKARLTWFMIKAVQTNPKYGVVRIFIEKDEKCIGKPDWLGTEFIKKKHVFRYYVKKDAGSLQSSKEKEEIQKQVIHNIDGIHGKAMNKMREKIRHDTMLSLLFMFEGVHDVNFSENNPEFVVDQIPEVNLDGFEEKVKERTVRRLWKSAKDSTSDMIITITYNVKVKTADGSLKPRTIVRKINVMNVSLSILIKLTCSKKLTQFFTMQKESMKYVYIFARLLWSGIKNKYEETELGACTLDSDLNKECKEIIDYLNVQLDKTRKNIMEEEVKKISEETFKYLNAEDDDEEKEYDSSDIEEPGDIFEDID